MDNQNITTDILKILKVKRSALGYSPEYMGLKLNISQKAYSDIENSRRKTSISELFKICRILEIKIHLDANFSSLSKEFIDL